jgi:hypothetical protein
MKPVKLLSAVVFLLAAIAGPSAGQEEGEYDEAGCGDPVPCAGGHFLIKLTSGNYYWGRHYDCRTGFAHAPCVWVYGDSLMRRAYLAAVDAAKSGDVRAILRLAPAARPYIIYNPERHAVQLLSCSRAAVIASITIVDEKQLRQALADSRLQ